MPWGLCRTTRGAALRILVAEDNPVNQRLAKALLEQRGYIVTLAGNGLEATTLLDQGEYDLALMDIQMPVMDGLEAAVAIRKKEQQTQKHSHRGLIGVCNEERRGTLPGRGNGCLRRQASQNRETVGGHPRCIFGAKARNLQSSALS